MISLHDITTIHNICAGNTDMINIREIHTLMQIYSEVDAAMILVMRRCLRNYFFFGLIRQLLLIP